MNRVLTSSTPFLSYRRVPRLSTFRLGPPPARVDGVKDERRTRVTEEG